MKHLAFCLCVIAGLAAAVFLVMNDHPWFALLVFVMVGCMECSDEDCTKGKA